MSSLSRRSLRGEAVLRPQPGAEIVDRCEELVARLRVAQSDPGLRDELRRLAAETTDELGPIR